MTDLGDGRGVLYPGRLPRFHRRAVPAELEHVARWFWISRWDLPPGVESPQSILPFPAANLVVQPEGVTLSGPTTGVSVRRLTGRGWAFGVLLRPAGLFLLGLPATELVDDEVVLDAVDLAVGVRAPMDADDDDAAATVVSEWLGALVSDRDGETPGAVGLAESMVDMAASDREVVSVDQLADRLGVSVRSVQRLAKEYIGQSPLRIIRRYRLQEAALRLREDHSLPVADVAAELGYSDQAHLAADFRTTLGLAPSDYAPRGRTEPPEEAIELEIRYSACCFATPVRVADPEGE